ncbi:putative quinol monooxygenase [Flavihumibacter petaseus]|uniref:ABM domain-containing protein n=1 Tax=Flavihumibacter petaseus NBRC 106054 TaxID=1220578 RepID=A0A0E9N5R0_9BACT|nr:antibiotic biosynthesis monooxygenase [Flavihumibacter petaseus]GAO44680.1 hypothetical protein FPE01S_03_07190 [Flavihumibacter petaseus NBRC 106054]
MSKQQVIQRSGIFFLSVIGILMLHQQAIAQQVARLTRYEVKPANESAFREALRSYVLQSLSSENNIMSEAYQEQDTAGVLWLIERWKDQGALDIAAAGIAFKAIQNVAGNALVQPAKILFVQDLEPLTKEQWRRQPGKEDKPMTIMLFVDAKTGTENQFRETYHKAMPEFRSEAGVINYQLSQLQSDNTQFVTYEKFRNEETFQYHLRFPPIQPVIDYLNTSIKKQPFQAGLHRLIEFAPEKHK